MYVDTITPRRVLDKEDLKQHVKLLEQYNNQLDQIKLLQRKLTESKQKNEGIEDIINLSQNQSSQFLKINHPSSDDQNSNLPR
jgi:hypothetical protein